MASIKDLKRQIISVKSTQQTTKALKMVSAAKLRRAQDAINAHRPFAKGVKRMIQILAAMPEQGSRSPLFGRDAADGDGGALPSVTVFVVTSDRGLCGGFNSNVIKAASRWIRENQTRYSKIELCFVGKKGYEFFKSRPFTMGQYFQEISGKMVYRMAKTMADGMVAKYLNGETDEVKVVYNEFKNAASQETVIEDFLPVKPMAPENASAGVEVADPMYIIRPSAPELLEELLSRHFAVQSFRVLLESQAGEHGARMAAMENATKNASEKIKELTLQYNKQRQAGITKELLEIIAGSESQKVS